MGRWTRAYHLKVPPPPLPPQPPRGGPRQRFLPTPRGVNMIVWSLDNRFVLAAIMGNVLNYNCCINRVGTFIRIYIHSYGFINLNVEFGDFGCYIVGK